jgi:hypothetical protein
MLLLKQHKKYATPQILTTGMPDCPASCQYDTGLEKTNDAGTSPVPE